MREARYCTCRYDADCAKRIRSGATSSPVVAAATANRATGAIAAERASRRGANVTKQAYYITIYRQQNAGETAARKPAAGCEYRNGLSDIAEHRFYDIGDPSIHTCSSFTV